MNMQLRAHNKSLNNQEPKRMFGKDITNICKGNIVNNLLKQHSLLKNQEENHKGIEKIIYKDPIHQYYEDIAIYMQKINYRQAMINQSSIITDKMRQILVDWMVDVHQSFDLKEETLQLAYMYLQDFQHKYNIKKEQYQLVGITCLWIASKFEEIYPPRMKNYVEITANTYSVTQLKEMEGKIIQTLNFELNRTTPLSLIKLLQVQSLSNQKIINMSQYLIELCILNGKIMKKYDNKTLILSALKLSDKIFMQQTSLGLIKPIEQNEQFYNCYKELCLLLQLQNKYKLSAMKRKYSKQKFLCVGKIRIQN